MATTHVLRTHPEPFAAVWAGTKTFEIRKDDRDFRDGDTLVLREFDPQTYKYSGREVQAEVTWRTHGPAWGLPIGMCVMAILVRERRGGETADDGLTALEKAARAATPGPWELDGPICVQGDVTPETWETVCMTGDFMESAEGEEKARNEADARFIAAANPSAVLALIERVRRAETPLVVETGEDPIRFAMKGGAVAYAAVARLDGRSQGIRFEPPVPDEEADKVLRVFAPELTPRDVGAPED